MTRYGMLINTKRCVGCFATFFNVSVNSWLMHEPTAGSACSGANCIGLTP